MLQVRTQWGFKNIPDLSSLLALPSLAVAVGVPVESVAVLLLGRATKVIVWGSSGFSSCKYKERKILKYIQYENHTGDINAT